MTTNDDLVPVSQFIAESERNIEIAAAIFEHYEEARAEIVKGFFDRLKKALQAKLPGWCFRYSEPFFDTRHGAFDMFKKPWKERYRIRIEAYQYGVSMGFGVWRDPELVGGIPLSAELLAAVKEDFPRATSRDYFEAEINMTSPAVDWRTPKALWRIHSDEAFRAEVEALLLQMVTLSEEHIDALVKVADGAKQP